MPGRNDPCPCGSGKKYKKCCLAKDNAAKAQAVLTAPAASTLGDLRHTPPPQLQFVSPPDPHMEALEARANEFERLDLDGKIRMFRQTLDELEFVDDESMFQMLDRIHDDGLREDRRDIVPELVAEFRQRHREVYEESRQFYLGWLIGAALASGGDVDTPALELAGLASDDMDMLTSAMDLLEYHGRLPLLRQMAQRAWPDVSSGENIMGWAIGEFAHRAAEYEILAHAEMAANPAILDTDLLSRISVYIEEPQTDYLAAYLVHLIGQANVTWTIDDVRMQRGRRDGTRRNLFLLGAEFMYHLHTAEGWPLTRARQVRENLNTYLEDRVNGALEDRSHGQHRKRSVPPPLHPLCPDQRSLATFLPEIRDMLVLPSTAATSLLEVLPAWTRFLEARQLLDPTVCDRVLEDLQPLVADIVSWVDHWIDPAQLQNLQDAWKPPTTDRAGGAVA